MHILFLTRRFSPSRGGVETHAREVAQELTRLGHQVTIFTEQHEVGLALQQSQSGLSIERLPIEIGENKFATWRWIWQHRQTFEQADVVHVHDVGWWIVPVLPWIWNKWFMTFHGWEGQFPPKQSSIWQRRLWDQLAQGVIQVGEFIEIWYGTKPDLLTYGGVNSTKISAKPDKNHIVVLGRLVTENNLLEVLKTLKLVKTAHPKLSITFVGDGPLRAECEKLGEVTGMVEHPEKYLAQAHIVFASSYLSILQAQAQGKLVVALYSHALKQDYLQKMPSASSMILESSPTEAAKKVVTTLNHPQRFSAQIVSAQKWALSQTWEKLTQYYLDLWKKLPDGIIET